MKRFPCQRNSTGSNGVKRGAYSSLEFLWPEFLDIQRCTKQIEIYKACLKWTRNADARVSKNCRRTRAPTREGRLRERLELTTMTGEGSYEPER